MTTYCISEHNRKDKMQFNLIDAKQEDVKHCIALINKTKMTMPTSEKETTSWLEDHINDGLFVVAKAQNEIVGFILAERLKLKGSMLWYVAVDPKFQHQGLGTKLLSNIEHRCKNIGIEWIIGYSEEATNILNFYKTNNFDIGKKYVEIYKDIQ